MPMYNFDDQSMISHYNSHGFEDPVENRALSHLIDSIPSLIANVDCNMVVRYANKPFQKFFSPQNTSSSFPLVVGKQVFQQVQHHLGKVLVGKAARFQISILREEGVQYLEVDLTPQWDENSNVTGFIFYGTDITEKLNTQRELSDYFENASIGLHWVNAEGIIIWANAAELKMLGYSEEEFIGQHLSKFHVNKKAILDILDRLNQGDILNNYEAELLCKDGSTRFVSINSSVLRAGEKFIHTRCFTIDITEQKLAGKAITESEERFKMMANLVPLVIWTTDEMGQMNFLSVRFKELTGKDIEEGLGDKWLNMVHPDDRDKIQHAWMSCLTDRAPFEAKFRYLSSTGVYAISYANASPRYNTLGNFVGYIGIFQDISTQEQIKSTLEKIVVERTDILRRRNAELRSAENALKEKNQELERTNRELSSFAHIASHDLQEPLRKIQTFANKLMAAEERKLSDRGKDFLRRIQNSADRMRELIEDLLEYSMTNNARDNLESTDLNGILHDVLNELELKIEEKNATIENLGLPRLNVLKFQFRQLFLNLLNNSLKFSKIDQAPHIVIKSEILQGVKLPHTPIDNSKNYHHITISDNGIGFEPELAEKIFEIFHRLHDKSDFEGTGIGLAICKRIVENHKGMIMADGQVNQGAAFHIYLPAQEVLT